MLLDWSIKSSNRDYMYVFVSQVEFVECNVSSQGGGGGEVRTITLRFHSSNRRYPLDTFELLTEGNNLMSQNLHTSR